MKVKLEYLIVFSLIGIMGFILIFEAKHQSLTEDEILHIGAGYIYLTKGDYRLNIEHPPLFKDLAAIPLLPLNLKTPSFQKPLNEEKFDRDFLFKLNKEKIDKIVWRARFVMIFIALMLGILLFLWAKNLSPSFSLVPLILFVFSPSFLAHSPLVTNDIFASLGFLAAIFFWLKLLRTPSLKNAFSSGSILGFALLTKFTTISLFIFLPLITLCYILIFSPSYKSRIVKFNIIGFIVAFLIIWIIYFFNTLNYPKKDIFYPFPFLKPIFWYFYGIIISVWKASHNKLIYFLGEINSKGFYSYFPILLLIKTPLAITLLFISEILFLSYKLEKPFWKNPFLRSKEWISNNFSEFTIILFVLFYLFFAVFSKINLGIRHILPIFPFLYLFVAINLEKIYLMISKSYVQKAVFFSFLVILLGFYISSSITVFPHYLSYYNELVGGPKNGYLYAVDSNYDWGQDLKYLAEFVRKNNIKKIYVDYFGGDDPKLRLGNKYTPYNPDSNYKPPHGWLAVSSHFLMTESGLPAKNYQGKSGQYRWLLRYRPVARAGYSIFIYRF